METMKKLAEFSETLGCTIQWNAPMKDYTTFKIGGPAKLLVTVTDAEQTVTVYRKALALRLPVMVIGKGSNLLCDDSGIPGVVLRLAGGTQEITLAEGGEVAAWAGVSLSTLCGFALKNALTGLEFAWGIPGTVGGALYMNAGAYGGDMAHIAVSAVHMDKTGKRREYSAKEMEFSYRHTVFSRLDGIILSIRLRLKKGTPALIKAAMDQNMNSRKTKQPLELPSAGSVFKRPGENIYVGPMLERCGLKGFRIGGAMVSEKHAGFIVNTGNATSAEVLALIKHIQSVVQEKEGLPLTCEVIRVPAENGG